MCKLRIRKNDWPEKCWNCLFLINKGHWICWVGKRRSEANECGCFVPKTYLDDINVDIRGLSVFINGVKVMEFYTEAHLRWYVYGSVDFCRIDSVIREKLKEFVAPPKGKRVWREIEAPDGGIIGFVELY